MDNMLHVSCWYKHTARVLPRPRQQPEQQRLAMTRPVGRGPAAAVVVAAVAAVVAVAAVAAAAVRSRPE